MSGLEIAAGVIGITDFGLRGIKGLYDFFQDLQDAREKLPQIWSELSHIQSNLSSLEFLSKADEDTLEEVRATGLTQGMNDCGSACDKLTRQLVRWTEKGVDSFTGKLKFKLHSAQIEKNRTRIWATARMLDMTVGILTLYDNLFVLRNLLIILPGSLSINPRPNALLRCPPSSKRLTIGNVRPSKSERESGQVCRDWTILGTAV